MSHSETECVFFYISDCTFRHQSNDEKEYTDILGKLLLKQKRANAVGDLLDQDWGLRG